MVLQWRKFHLLYGNGRWADSERSLMGSVIYTTALLFYLHLNYATQMPRKG